MFDISKLKPSNKNENRYERRISQLKNLGYNTDCIEKTVTDAVSNIKKAETRAFVIYGEPQSGKTEMMIALTARLLDEGYSKIIHLLNDSLQLLGQNLERFQRSGLAPSPCNYTEILDPSIKIKEEARVIFCKKNARDLPKLIDKINHIDGKVIIDDEADFATPNAKINKGEKTKINELIEELLGHSGVYVGVTATPARLDLNNTFENDHEKWVDFPPHEKYTGQEIFFPLSSGYKYQITWIPSGAGDEPKWCRDALFGFLINAARLNTDPNIEDGGENYSFLVHTSGKKVDHTRDYQLIQKVFGVLSDTSHNEYESYVENLWNVAEGRFPDQGDELTRYVLENIGRRNIVVMNSDKHSNDYKSATSPSSLFTVVIGGNIVSRGVTFENLLGMYFTRDVKHKIKQDTYIQRARMFGARGDYLSSFELTIPENLYLDWHRCFIFHRLSLDAIRSGRGAPVWLEDHRVAAVAPSSVDKSNVSMDSGEMSFGMFWFETYRHRLEEYRVSETMKNSQKLTEIQRVLGEQAFPGFLLSYIKKFNPGGDSAIMIHPPLSIEKQKGADVANISRKKGFMGGAAFTGNANVTHHFRVLNNAEGKARLFYKLNGNIRFLKNLKDSPRKISM